MTLSSTQIGAIGENLLINAVMKASDGRLSPFQPLADDDGIDVLFFDKLSGGSLAIQLKCRTVTLFRRGTQERGNVTHFEVRRATFSATRRTYLVTALLDSELATMRMAWLMPLAQLPVLGRSTASKFVIRPSMAEACKDRFVSYRCTATELATRIVRLCEEPPG